MEGRKIEMIRNVEETERRRRGDGEETERRRRGDGEETERRRRGLTNRMCWDHRYCGRHIDMFGHLLYAILYIIRLEGEKEVEKGVGGAKRQEGVIT